MNYPLYNDTLCPDVWDKKGDEYVMKPEIRENLLEIVGNFVDSAFIENDLGLDVEDVYLIGSLANYNWTQFSDFDIHLVVDFAQLDTSPELAQILVDGLKGSWNKNHAISIKGHEVEMYVQDVSAKPNTQGIYSVMNGKWVKVPTKKKPELDKEFIKKKHLQFKKKLDAVLKNPTEKAVETMLEKLYDMRQAGMDKKGEFSEENIVFKILRAQGYLDKIKDVVHRLFDKEHTIVEKNQRLSSD